MTARIIPAYELAEWSQLTIPGLELTAQDRSLADTFASRRQGRLGIDELRAGLRFSASSWVGVVRFSTFEVRVVPKLAGSNLRLVEMINFTSGLAAMRRNSSVSYLKSVEDASLLDLIAMMLATECERVLRAGLMSDYVEEEDDLPVIRGRLLADRQLRERFGRVDRVICRFDERKKDVAENQLLALALEVSARRAELPSVRRKARQLAHTFASICEPSSLDPRVARSEIVYDRMNQHYQPSHELAWLILDGFGIDDLYSQGNTRVFSFLLNMNSLFEKFVHKVLQQLFVGSDLRVQYQRANRSIICNAATGKPYSRVVPDFLVVSQSHDGRLVLDAKYKLFDTIHVSTADVYQAFLYAYAFGCDELKTPVAGLIFPTQNKDNQHASLTVRSAGNLADATVALIGLHIPTVLDEINQNKEFSGGSMLAEFLASINWQDLGKQCL